MAPKKKESKMNDYEPTELDEIKSIMEKTNERVDALAELLGDLEGEVKEIRGKTYPGDIANAIREGFGSLVARAPSVAAPPASVPQAPQLDFDIFSITWKQKGGAVAPANPNWGWAFGYNQDGGYHEETKKLVKYLESYKVLNVGDYTVKLGGRDNRLLQLNKKRE